MTSAATASEPNASAPSATALSRVTAHSTAAWSVDERLPVAVEWAVTRDRAVALGALAFGSLAVAALVIALAAAPAGYGLAWTIVGAGSAVGVVGLAVTLARRS